MESRLKSLLLLKCPKCHKGNLFSNKRKYAFKNVIEMPDKRPVCNQSFNPETGFYFGAMFVSYGLTVAIGLIIFILMYLIWGWLTMPYLITVTIAFILLYPFIARYSRAIWIYMFVSYDSGAGKKD